MGKRPDERQIWLVTAIAARKAGAVVDRWVWGALRTHGAAADTAMRLITLSIGVHEASPADTTKARGELMMGPCSVPSWLTARPSAWS